jgi:osmotically-inducible protein OsmY
MENFIEGENVRENVKKELSRNTLLRDENILVDIEGDEIVLEGGVDSFDKKWLAEDIAADTLGVLHVKNNIYVVNDNDHQSEVFYED